MQPRGQSTIETISEIRIQNARDESMKEIRECCNWHARLEGVCYIIRWIKQDGTMEIAISCKWPSVFQSLSTKDWINIEENSRFWELIKSSQSLHLRDIQSDKNFLPEITRFLQIEYEKFFKVDYRITEGLFLSLDPNTREKVKNSLSDFEIAISNCPAVNRDKDFLEKLRNLKGALLKEDEKKVNWSEVNELLEDIESLINLKYPYSNVARAFHVFCGFVMGGVIGTQYCVAAAASVALAPWMVGALAGSAIVGVLLLAYHAYTYRSTSQLGMFKAALDKGLVFCSAVESAMKTRPSY